MEIPLGLGPGPECCHRCQSSVLAVSGTLSKQTKSKVKRRTVLKKVS